MQRSSITTGMPASSKRAQMRAFTSSLCPLHSSGAKNTPSALRAMNCAAQLLSLLLQALRLPGVPPKKRIRARFRRRRHTLANGLEDLGLAQIRDQQSEQQAALGGRCAFLHKVPGTRHAGHVAALLQLPQRPADGDPRSAETPHQRRFARQLLAGFVLALTQIFQKGVEDLLIQWRGHYLILQDNAGGPQRIRQLWHPTKGKEIPCFKETKRAASSTS